MKNKLYNPQLMALLELLWITGFLSPAGTDEVARLMPLPLKSKPASG
jgi:hypothetical protein